MIIRCIAHAMFLLETAEGLRIVTDPVDASSGYDVEPVRCDAVLVSHDHHDHCAMGSVKDAVTVIREEGRYTLTPEVSVKAIQAWHDDAQGAKRGRTQMFLIEADGLRIVHTGDLGHLLDQRQIAALAPVDVLMVPVGGFFTIDAKQAMETARLLKAKMILPMHYKTACTADWPVAPVDDFLSLCKAQDVSRQTILRVTAGDLMCQPKVCVLEPQLKG